MTQSQTKVPTRETEEQRLRKDATKHVSFDSKVRNGWTKEQLMNYYVISDRTYERILTTLKALHERR